MNELLYLDNLFLTCKAIYWKRFGNGKRDSRVRE